jgi:hypothetical protein
MKIFEIYWEDLTPEAQERNKDLYHSNINLTPIAIIDNDDDEILMDDEGYCAFCGQKCWEGEMCDEQQAGGF